MKQGIFLCSIEYLTSFSFNRTHVYLAYLKVLVCDIVCLAYLLKQYSPLHCRSHKAKAPNFVLCPCSKKQTRDLPSPQFTFYWHGILNVPFWTVVKRQDIIGIFEIHWIGFPSSAFTKEQINSQSLEDMQVGYISQKYSLDKYTSERAFKPSYTLLEHLSLNIHCSSIQAFMHPRSIAVFWWLRQFTATT